MPVVERAGRAGRAMKPVSLPGSLIALPPGEPVIGRLPIAPSDNDAPAPNGNGRRRRSGGAEGSDFTNPPRALPERQTG
ncbi:MAG: hypothetical protein LC672_03470, partial [Acidobacteria bacterium]|nr:hypothetical protein [Acidobacteriota bacterium]